MAKSGAHVINIMVQTWNDANNIPIIIKYEQRGRYVHEQRCDDLIYAVDIMNVWESHNSEPGNSIKKSKSEIQNGQKLNPVVSAIN